VSHLTLLTVSKKIPKKLGEPRPTLTKSSVYAHRVRRATCEDSHPTFECHHHKCVCMSTGTTRHPPHCPHNGYSVANDANRFRCKCTAYPYNPFSGEPVTGDLMRTTLSAKATDGNNTLYPISFPAVTTCVPDSMLEELPVGAVSVARLARLAAATTEVEEVDGGPPGGAGGKVRQRPPPKLKTSMVGPQDGEWLRKSKDKCSKNS
jgi:hypothetical protein